MNTHPGVGPHPQPWPIGDRYDPELLANGDSRNVVDAYRYWTVEAIKQDLNAKAVPLEIAIENIDHDFNIGTIVRTANAFNVRTVHIIGRRHWNRRGAMVTDAYMNIVHHQTAADFLQAVHGKAIIAVDIVPGSQPMASATLPEQSVLVFGSEGQGISDELLAAADMVVAIEQAGSTRSVNVGVAAGIAMYLWELQNKLTH